MGIFQEIREFGHRYDPIGANIIDNVIRNDSRVVAEISRGADRLLGRPTPMGRLTRDEARRNIADPARAVSRAAATMALIYGIGQFGAAAAGSGTGAGTAGGAAAGGGATGAGASSMSIGAHMGGSMGAGATLGEAGTLAAGGGWEAAALGGGAGAAAGSAGSQATADTVYQGSAAQSGGTAPSGGTGRPWYDNQTVRSIGTGVATQTAASLLSPKPQMPEQEKPQPMPDPEAQAAARRRRLAAQRRGRAASILTDQGY